MSSGESENGDALREARERLDDINFDMVHDDLTWSAGVFIGATSTVLGKDDVFEGIRFVADAALVWMKDHVGSEEWERLAQIRALTLP